VGGLLGVIAWAFILTLLFELVAGAAESVAGAGFRGLALLITMPIGGLLGALWGMRRARRAQRARQPIDPGDYPNRVIRRDRPKP
jgi:hypothetical protein